MREVAHNGQETGDEDASAAIVHKRFNVAEAVAGPPRLHVVGVPNGRHEDGEDVLDLDDNDEDNGGELSVAVQEPERHETDEVGNDGEDDADDEVGREGRGDEWWFIGSEHENGRGAPSCNERKSLHCVNRGDALGDYSFLARYWQCSWV